VQPAPARSGHIVSDPLALSAFVYAGQSFVLSFCLVSRLIKRFPIWYR
jgi:hypothetical protein